MLRNFKIYVLIAICLCMVLNNPMLANSTIEKNTASSLIIIGSKLGTGHGYYYDTYTANGEKDHPILVANKTLNCQGETNGIDIYSSSAYLIIENVTVNCPIGINIYGSQHIIIRDSIFTHSPIKAEESIFYLTITGNTLIDGLISIRNGGHISISDNSITSTKLVESTSYGIQIGTTSDSTSYHPYVTITNNVLENAMIKFYHGVFVNITGNEQQNIGDYKTFNSSYVGYDVLACNSCNITNNKAVSNYMGFSFNYYTNSKFKNNIIYNSINATMVGPRTNATFEDNTITNCSTGIDSTSLMPNTYDSNKITNCTIGIDLEQGEGNVVKNNVFTNVGIPIKQGANLDNTIESNVINSGTTPFNEYFIFIFSLITIVVIRKNRKN